MSLKATDKIDRLHRDSVAAGSHHYIDPETGYLVFTELAHRARGHCCGNECRHCPYEADSENDPLEALSS